MTYNDRPARLLFGDDDSPQSGIALDEDLELLFDYNQRFMEIAASVQLKKVLIIGGGAFSLPTALVQRFAGIHVDVVEIDPLLPDLARRFFNLSNHPNLSIYIEDGRDFLGRTTTEYDLIIVDAFSGLDVPKSLLSVEAARLYRSKLTDKGLVSINFISAYHVTKPDLAHQLQATFDGVFNGVEIYPADHTNSRITVSDNLVLVASGDLMPSLDYLHSAPLSPLIGVDAQAIHD